MGAFLQSTVVQARRSSAGSLGLLAALLLAAAPAARAQLDTLPAPVRVDSAPFQFESDVDGNGNFCTANLSGPLDVTAPIPLTIRCTKTDGFAGQQFENLTLFQGAITITSPAMLPNAERVGAGSDRFRLDAPVQFRIEVAGTISRVLGTVGVGTNRDALLETQAQIVGDAVCRGRDAQTATPDTPSLQVALVTDCEFDELREGVDAPLEAPISIQISELGAGYGGARTTLDLRLGYRGSSSVDLSFDRIELVQAIQTESKQVVMAAGKRTVTRVFLDTEDQNVPGVSARMRAHLDGGPTPWLAPFNTLPWTAPASWSRTSEDDSLNFLLPQSWTSQAGTLTLDLEILPPPGVADPDLGNNQTTHIEPFAVSRNAQNPFTVAYLPLAYDAPDLPRVAPPAIPAQSGELLRRLYPIADDGLAYFQLPTPPLTWRRTLCTVDATLAASQSQCLFGEDDLQIAIRKLFHLTDFFTDFDQTVDQIMAWLPAGAETLDTAHRNLSLGSADAILLGGEGRTAFGLDTTPTGGALDVAFTTAHELAHNFGRRHTNTADGCGASDEGTNWPHATAGIQDPGFDPNNPGRPEFKNVDRFDILSYCSPATSIWTSATTYNGIDQSRLQPRLTEEGDESPAAGAPRPLQIFDTPRDFLLISGRAARDGSSGSLEPVLRLPSRIEGSAPDPSGNHCIRLSGDAGTLAEHCFELTFQHRESLRDLDHQTFSIKIEAPQGVTRVSMRRGGQELVAIDASGSAPSVSIASPAPGAVWNGSDTPTIQWSGQDPDGDPLTYVVQYSPDGGRSWLPLDFPTADTSLALDASRIQGGDDVRLRVLASDGLLTAAAEVGPIQVVQQPSIAVDSPVDLRKAVVGQSRLATILIRNDGTGPLRLNGATSQSETFRVTGTHFPLRIPAGGEGSVGVEFIPPSVGDHAGTVSLSASAFGRNVTVVGEGIEAPEPDVTASPPLDFGSTAVGQAAVRQAFIENFGPGSALIQSVAVEGAAFALVAPVPAQTIGAVRLPITVRFTPVAAGPATGVLIVRTNDPGAAELRIALSGTGAGEPSGDPPVINAGGVVDAAQFQAVLAPGGLGSIFGVSLANQVAGATATPLPTTLAGTRVLINGVAAPLVFVSSGQINFQLPFEVADASAAEIRVGRNGVTGPPVEAASARFAPQFFANAATGEPIVTRPDGSLVDAAAPAEDGEILIAYLTGVGGLDNPPPSGAATPGSPLAASTVPAEVTIGGAPAEVFFAGLTPGFVGLAQLNIRVRLAAALAAEGGPQGASARSMIARFGAASSRPVDLPVAAAPGGGSPVMAVSPESLDYGDVAVGAEAVEAVAVFNQGAAALHVSGATVDNAAFRIISSLPLTIGPNRGDLIEVAFAPASGGPQTATLRINGNDPATPVANVTLRGNGVGGSSSGPVVLEPSLVDFGQVAVGASPMRTLTLRNEGQTAATVDSLLRSGDAAFSLTGAPETPFSLAPGASRAFSVVFTPQAAGAYNAVIEARTADATLLTTVRGSATASSSSDQLVVAPSVLFGAVPLGRIREVRITARNPGATPLQVVSISGQSGAFRVAQPALPFVIPANGETLVLIRFEPAEIGPQSTTLVYTTATGGTAQTSLNGSGAAGSPVVFSDSFERADALTCALGRADHAYGGAGPYSYGLIAAGVTLETGKLVNKGRDYGGVIFARDTGTCPGAGTDLGESLNIRARLFTPRDGSKTTQAGPFFHAPRLGSGQPIHQGGQAGVWVKLDSSGRIDVVRLDTNEILAVSPAPAAFDAATPHDVEVSVQRRTLVVTVDKFLRRFDQGARTGSETVDLPSTPGEAGGAGVAFGAEDGFGSVRGQFADDVIVRDYETLLGSPVAP